MSEENRWGIKLQTRRSVWWIAVAVALWVGCNIAITWYLLDRDTATLGAASWLLAALPMLIGCYVLWLYVRLNRTIDELTAKVQLDALALAFGVLTLTAMMYPTLEIVGAPHLGIRGYLAVGWATYFASLLYSSWRYR